MDPDHRKRIDDVCERAKAIVATWPDWKRSAVESVFSERYEGPFEEE